MIIFAIPCMTLCRMRIAGGGERGDKKASIQERQVVKDGGRTFFLCVSFFVVFGVLQLLSFRVLLVSLQLGVEERTGDGKDKREALFTFHVWFRWFLVFVATRRPSAFSCSMFVWYCT